MRTDLSLSKSVSARASTEVKGSTRRGRGALDSWNLSGSSPLASEELRECILRYQTDGDASAGARVIESHMRLVAKMARGHASGTVLTDDLMAEGALALRRSLDTFALDRGPSFTSYASVAVGHALRAAARKDRQPVRIPSAENRKAAARHRAEASFFAREGRWPTLAEVESDRAVERARIGLTHGADRLGERSAVQASGGSLVPAGNMASDRLEPTVAQRAWMSLDGGAEDGSLQASQIPDGAPTPADLAGHRDDLVQITGALAVLPEAQSRAIRLRFGLSEETALPISEVAQRMGVPVFVAERAIMSGLRQLRATLRAGCSEKRIAG